MKHLKTPLIIIGLLLYGILANAQVANADKASIILPDEQADLQSQLLPFDDILTIAIQNSPTVKFQGDLVDNAQAQLEMGRKQWTNNIVGFSNYSGGNQNLITSDNQTAGSTAYSNISTGYRVGIQINLPLYELVGRSSRLKSYKSELKSTIDKKDESVLALKQNLIQAYYNLLYYSNLLNIRSEAKQTTINQYEIAQKQFKDGVIDISELSRLKTIEVNARADYEDAKRQFSTYYFGFETMVGVPFQQLLKQK